ncbi:MAG: SDR family oxidoreductase [Kiloniellaceae bacterium]
MNILIIEGVGLIGPHLAELLGNRGHSVEAASPASIGGTAKSGIGSRFACKDVVVDISDTPPIVPPAFADEATLAFFAPLGANLLAAERNAGVGHHLSLSVVGVDRFPDSPNLAARSRQENLLRASGLPHTILRATPLFECVASFVEAGNRGATVHVSPALIQPVASADVAAVLATLVTEPPLYGTREIAGPERQPLDVFAQLYLEARGDDRRVIADVRARYYGTVLDDRSLLPGADPIIGSIRFQDWLGGDASSA